MLAVVGRVLRAVHAGVFEALDAPGAPGPHGRLAWRDWDVRVVLQEQRMQVLAQDLTPGFKDKYLILDSSLEKMLFYSKKEPLLTEKNRQLSHANPPCTCWTSCLSVLFIVSLVADSAMRFWPVTSCSSTLYCGLAMRDSLVLVDWTGSTRACECGCPAARQVLAGARILFTG